MMKSGQILTHGPKEYTSANVSVAQTQSTQLHLTISCLDFKG